VTDGDDARFSATEHGRYRAVTGVFAGAAVGARLRCDGSDLRFGLGSGTVGEMLIETRVRAAIIAAAVALGLAGALYLWGGDSRATSPRSVEGWAMPDASGTAVSLHDSPTAEWGEGYIIAGASWRGTDNLWHQGDKGPTCVGTDTTSLTHVRLGVVTVGTPEGTRWERVAWLECLE
jgi:hypothetical protein